MLKIIILLITENVGREKGAIQGEIRRQTEEGIEKEATFFG